MLIADQWHGICMQICGVLQKVCLIQLRIQSTFWGVYKLVHQEHLVFCLEISLDTNLGDIHGCYTWIVFITSPWQYLELLIFNPQLVRASSGSCHEKELGFPVVLPTILKPVETGVHKAP